MSSAGNMVTVLRSWHGREQKGLVRLYLSCTIYHRRLWSAKRRSASGNLGASGQWAGRVFSVICQVRTNIFVAVETVPILDAFRLRGDPRERAPRPPPGLRGDWPSLFQRARSPAHWSCQSRYTCRQKS